MKFQGREGHKDVCIDLAHEKIDANQGKDIFHEFILLSMKRSH